MLPLYSNIKKFREKAGMSQEELALKTGYTSRTSIAKIEAGAVDLPQSKIIKFAKALKTTPAQLMGWENEEDMKLLIKAVSAYEKLESTYESALKQIADTIGYTWSNANEPTKILQDDIMEFIEKRMSELSQEDLDEFIKILDNEMQRQDSRVRRAEATWKLSKLRINRKREKDGQEKIFDDEGNCSENDK